MVRVKISFVQRLSSVRSLLSIRSNLLWSRHVGARVIAGNFLSTFGPWLGPFLYGSFFMAYVVIGNDGHSNLIFDLTFFEAFKIRITSIRIRYHKTAEGLGRFNCCEVFQDIHFQRLHMFELKLTNMPIADLFWSFCRWKSRIFNTQINTESRR